MQFFRKKPDFSIWKTFVEHIEQPISGFPEFLSAFRLLVLGVFLEATARAEHVLVMLWR